MIKTIKVSLLDDVFTQWVRLWTDIMAVLMGRKKEEARTLLQMLPKYHKYMKRNGGRSILTRFCGVYGVSLRTSGTVKR